MYLYSPCFTAMVKFFQFLFSIYAFIVFVALMLLLFPLVIVASFFGKVRGGNIIYNICRFWADAALFLWGMRHKNIFLAPKDTQHAVIFVFNHISYLDIPFLLKAFRKQPIRILGKAEMARIPIFGYIYKKATVMVQRSSSQARAQSVIQLKEMLKKNISIVIAPEGTFNMTGKPLKEFYNGAFKIAIETKTTIQPVIFLDAYDRLNYHSIFSFTPGRSRAVFLPPVKVYNDNLAEMEALKTKVFKSMEFYLRSYQASWINK